MRVDTHLTEALGQVVAFTQNGLEAIRYGGLDSGEERSPHTIVERQPMYRLRRYFADEADPAAPPRPPIVLVSPMMLSADLWDVSVATSAVRRLHEAGLDPWVVDFGSPEREAGGSERTLSDHVIAVSDVVDTVVRTTGRQVHLAGYCQGGLFCYQAAAYRRASGLASIITFGSPTDFFTLLPLGLPTGALSKPAEFLADHVFSHISIPPWAARLGFNTMDPLKTARSQFDFVRQLHDRDALIGRENQRRFITNEGYVGWSGPAIVELLQQFVASNRMMTGGFVIGDRALSLADIDCPILAFVGEADGIGKPAAVRGLRQAVTTPEVYETVLKTGHLGLVLGSAATRQTWPGVASWVRWQEGGGARPAGIEVMAEASHDEGSTSGRVQYAGTQLAEIGGGVSRRLLDGARGALRASQSLVGEAAHTLPRLLRLEQLDEKSRISIGSLLNDRARRDPNGECFLFDDRVHTNSAVSTRVDNVVRGLVHVGVRQGDHVGVLMETRPSALVAIAALSRLGAVAVLLPPDHAAAAVSQSRLASIIVDPNNLVNAAGCHRQLLVLGGGGDDRPRLTVPDEDVIDLERIDPHDVVLPKWYRPDPGLGGDLAFVLFSSSGEHIRPRMVTNHRWALSAVGTASVAALSRADTVYCLTPLHHPAGLMTAVGGALAGGSRIALSRGFAPQRFEEEVRRYGVTVVSYTWMMLHPLLRDAPAGEGHGLPIRLFLGSGMPTGMWRRVNDHYPSARVVELYASPDSEAVLANVSGAAVGAKGRPLPGSAEVVLAAYDADSGSLRKDEHGFLVPCRPGEAGLLLCKPLTATSASSRTMRGVFRRGDAWVRTDDLFRQDANGDYWLLDSVRTLGRGRRGAVPAQPVAEALEALDGVDVAVPFRGREADESLALVAVTLLPGAAVTGPALTRALSALPTEQRPDAVYVVDEIPLTRSFRPDASQLQSAELRERSTAVYRYDVASGHYKKAVEPVSRERTSASSSASSAPVSS